MAEKSRQLKTLKECDQKKFFFLFLFLRDEEKNFSSLFFFHFALAVPVTVFPVQPWIFYTARRPPFVKHVLNALSGWQVAAGRP